MQVHETEEWNGSNQPDRAVSPRAQTQKYDGYEIIGSQSVSSNF